MRGGRKIAGSLLVGAVGSGLLFAPLDAAGQTGPSEVGRTQFGIGYVANAPDLMAGAGGYLVAPVLGGLGFFVDVKFDVEDPSDTGGFEPGLTAREVGLQVSGATFIEGESSYKSMNVGLVRPVTPFLMVYGGGGIARRTHFEAYQEPTRTLGRGGVFWVKDPSRKEDRLNLMLGLMMRVGPRIAYHFGFETQPRGITAGFSLRFPFR